MANGSQTFSEQLAFGRIAESRIANWLRLTCGYTIIPAYDVEHHTGKGPQVFTPSDEYVAPDMLAIRGDEIKWIEAKHKTVFTWHRMTGRWVTGIDLHHYRQYQRVAFQLTWPVWILFLHQQDIPDPRDSQYGCPSKCPIGLFAQELEFLTKHENHQHTNHGRHGMVYWAHQTLKLIASIAEVDQPQPKCIP